MKRLSCAKEAYGHTEELCLQPRAKNSSQMSSNLRPAYAIQREMRSRSRSQSDSMLERMTNGVLLDHEAALWHCSPCACGECLDMVLRFKTHSGAHHAQI
ncbi:hypothetical protein GmHk_04G010191 [Glycine max]|nr:hypothetical protein JHK86_009752 [Glycine max]KAH1253572.1 hypothetical protein GmHk_04G010191 [Glycine max]